MNAAKAAARKNDRRCILIDSDPTKDAILRENTYTDGIRW
jgi:hypothetical protein